MREKKRIPFESTGVQRFWFLLSEVAVSTKSQVEFQSKVSIQSAVLSFSNREFTERENNMKPRQSREYKKRKRRNLIVRDVRIEAAGVGFWFLVVVPCVTRGACAVWGSPTTAAVAGNRAACGRGGAPAATPGRSALRHRPQSTRPIRNSRRPRPAANAASKWPSVFVSVAPLTRPSTWHWLLFLNGGTGSADVKTGSSPLFGLRAPGHGTCIALCVGMVVSFGVRCCWLCCCCCWVTGGRSRRSRCG